MMKNRYMNVKLKDYKRVKKKRIIQCLDHRYYFPNYVIFSVLQVIFFQLSLTAEILEVKQEKRFTAADVTAS